MLMKKFLFLAAAAAIAGSTSAPAENRKVVIHAGHLIAEPGKPALERKSVLIDAGKIVAIEDGFVPGEKVIDLKESWVMPGLIDMHTHITGVLKLDEPASGQLTLAHIRPPARVVLGMLPRLKALLMGGFTTIRNLYDPSETTYALRDAINQGSVSGPRMFAVEAQIAVDSGDLDVTNMDVRTELEPSVANRGNCTGVVECVKAVRAEVRRGADLIKLRQSGLAALDPKIAMAETPEEMKAIIDTAHQLDRRVAVHVVGTSAFLHLIIKAGADTIEHGPLDDESIKLMKERGTAYTPTLLAQKLTDSRFKEASEGTAKAWKAGVPIIFGTDLGIFDADRSHEEFELMAASGIPGDQVLRAATVNAAAALGKSDTLGTIAPGRIADVIATRSDPSADVGQLGDPAKVQFVMKEGEVFKDER